MDGTTTAHLHDDEHPDGRKWEAVLAARTSTKPLSAEPLPAAQLIRLLDGAVGERPDGSRRYPSAHAHYPVDVFVAVGGIDGLQSGAYLFHAAESSMIPVTQRDHRHALARATLDAAWAAESPALLLLAADLDAAGRAFQAQGRGRGARYCWIEAGAVVQNVHLCAAALGLGTVFLGGIDDDAMRAAAQPVVGSSRSVLGLLPLGFAAGCLPQPVSAATACGAPGRRRRSGPDDGVNNDLLVETRGIEPLT
ncbi:SagB/ThcOx family dehydrogenase [Tomitella gaofuii]|uniref:SagB/ThcOx family dehydrogenase n=1 Tax=Tomitella gaofuii TaxID=2760083 RepID=UPI0015F7FF1B|nr:SagB/ThcOx family dehydrogenase [Tomitella gaofuii]